MLVCLRLPGVRCKDFVCRAWQVATHLKAALRQKPKSMLLLGNSGFVDAMGALSYAARNAQSPDDVSDAVFSAAQDAKTQLDQANAALQAAQRNFAAAQAAVLNFGQ